MKINQKNILIIPIILVLIIFFVCFLGNQKEANFIKANLGSKSNQTLSENQKGSIEEKKISLRVLDKVYEIKINDGESLYSAMVSLENENKENFSFKYKEYPSLGVFVNEINNIKAENGKYWFYYIDGQEASVGVSSYILEAGDIISWELK